MKNKNVNVESLLNDKRLLDELLDKLSRKNGTEKTRQFNVDSGRLTEIIEKKDLKALSTRPLSEAIILDYGRPALLVKNNTFVIPESDTWKNRLEPSRSLIDRAIKSVGRIELEGHPEYPWVGTGWLIAEDVIITNRHVALVFAQKKGKNSFKFRLGIEGNPLKARIDFREEYKIKSSHEFEINGILYVAPDLDNEPDYAFLKLKRSNNLPEPLLMHTKSGAGELVAVIGYPARDGRRNDNAIMNQIFGDIYNVKRFQPGQITKFEKQGFIFNHDSSTLGGNSGSAVIDIDNGMALGLHYGGIFHQNNYAVKAERILKQLSDLKISVPVSKIETEITAISEEKPEVLLDLSDRGGYQEKFLGVKVSLPSLEAVKKDVLVVNKKAKNELGKHALHYTHFSVVMNKSRKLAFFSACNIDGDVWFQVPRKSRTEQWYFDERIPRHFQTGNDVYLNNDLDRGHLTRREDPLWGTRKIAEIANEDTFHFTNACPQHKDLNQKIWLGLERYVLDSAKANELKVTVFTGPVFNKTDPEYRGIQIPREYWKILVIVNSDTRKLSATGYLLSQSEFIADLEEGPSFAYGKYKTYQVPIKKIESLTKLGFTGLSKADPLNRITESVSEFVPIRSYTEMVF